MKKLTIIKAALIAVTIIPATSYGQNQLKPKADMLKLIDKNFADADKQYRLLIRHVPADSMAETFEHNKWVSVAANNWVSGFYPGALFYLYKATKDTVLYHEGLRRLKVMEPEQKIDS